jgi:hypothetical protein
MDINMGDEYDMLSPRGLANAVVGILRIRHEGCACGGIPCSWWTYLCSSLHKRTKANPDGDVEKEAVRRSNRLAWIWFTLLKIAWVRSVHGFTEQPGSSMLYNHASFKSYESFVPNVNRCWFYMGNYGNELPKPTCCQTTLRGSGNFKMHAGKKPPRPVCPSFMLMLPSCSRGLSKFVSTCSWGPSDCSSGGIQTHVHSLSAECVDHTTASRFKLEASSMPQLNARASRCARRILLGNFSAR